MLYGLQGTKLDSIVLNLIGGHPVWRSKQQGSSPAIIEFVVMEAFNVSIDSPRPTRTVELVW